MSADAPVASLQSLDELAQFLRSSSADSHAVLPKGTLGREDHSRLLTLLEMARNKGINVDYEPRDLDVTKGERLNLEWEAQRPARRQLMLDEILSAPSWVRDTLDQIYNTTSDAPSLDYVAQFWVTTLRDFALAIEAVGEPPSLTTLQAFVQSPEALADHPRMTPSIRRQHPWIVNDGRFITIRKAHSFLTTRLGWPWQ